TPTITRTPTITPIASSTPTASATPTITPTPTPLPLDESKDEEPDLAIPDGPNGVATSTMSFPHAVTIREARVFLNIDHDDVADLEVNLIHPDGTLLRIRSQGEDDGDDDIRRWFSITGAALNSIRGKPSQGTWTLQVIDTIEGRTGELLSWSLEIYP
nr:proprotein convertase P-domain-containing protein [Geodermatophilaceae bacterium]